MHLDAPYKQPEGVLGYMHVRKRRWSSTVLRVLAVLVLLGGGAFTAMFIVPQGSADAPAVTVTLTHDTAVETLRAAGVLRYPTAFRTLLAARGATIPGGTYTLSPHLSVWSLARVVTTTQPRPERTVRIIEGWSTRDIGAYLEREGIATADAFYALVGAPAADYRRADAGTRPTQLDAEFSFLAERSEFVGLEGYLFPDTYRVYEDASLEDIVRKLLAHFDTQMTPELRAEIAASGRTLHQIVTMASIVEKEVGDDVSRPIVADILWKRRDNGWLLQSDATVNYVTGKSDPRTRLADHAVDSSFNTYKYPGLPHGPISNPGMASILAALRPKASPYWFFLTGPDGAVHFARSLDEHNANIRKYLQ